jgi:ATP-binding cassette subfamily G (WHITE) protein 2
LLDVIAPSRTGVEKLDELGDRQVPVDLTLGSEKPVYTQDGARSWRHEFCVLAKRSFHQYARRRDLIVFNLIATVVIAIFIGFGFWRDIGTDQDSVPKRLPSLFFAMVNQGVVGSLQAVTSFPMERAITLRERASGSYHVSSYFMAKTIVDLTTSLWPPVLFASLVYFAVGYQLCVGKFFIFVMFTVLDTYAATSLSTLGTAFRSICCLRPCG